MQVCAMDNLRNYLGNYLFQTEKYVKLLGVMILWHFLIEVCWAHGTKGLIFYFPVDTLAYVMNGSFLSPTCKLVTHFGYLQVKRGSNR